MQPLIGAKTCGNCAFGQLVPEALTELTQCEGLPPQVILLGRNPQQQPVFQMCYPRIPRTQRACALHQRRVETSAANVPDQALVK